jgi:hypothetical protein
MKINFLIGFSLLAIVTGTVTDQDWKIMTKEQLLDKNYRTGIFRYTTYEYAAIANNSKKYY